MYGCQTFIDYHIFIYDVHGVGGGQGGRKWQSVYFREGWRMGRALWAGHIPWNHCDMWNSYQVKGRGMIEATRCKVLLGFELSAAGWMEGRGGVEYIHCSKAELSHGMAYIPSLIFVNTF